MLSPQVCSILGNSLPVYTVSCEDNLNENLPFEPTTTTATVATPSPGKREHRPTYLGCMSASLFHHEAIIQITSDMMEEKDLEPSTCQTACLAIPGHMR